MKWPGWLTAQVLSLAAIGVLAFLWVGARNEIREAKAAAAQAKTSQQLAEAGIQEAKRVSAQELAAERNLSQRRLADALKKAGIRGETVFVASGSTGPVQVGGVPLAQAPGSAQVPGAEAPSSSSASGPACVLREDDSGEIRVTAAGVKTEAGNIAVDGQAEAWRLNPEARLFGGPLRLDVKVSPQVPEPRAAGWGAGMATVLTRQGFTLGPAVAAPVLNLPFRLQAEASAVLTLNPKSSEWAGTASVVLRRR